MPLPKLTNTALIEGYIRQQTGRWRPETLRVRRAQLGRIAAALPVPLADATEEHLLAWHAKLRGRPETIASYTSAAHGLYRWMAVRARPRIRDDDPTIILDRPRIPDTPPRPMLDRHYDLALACAVADPEMYVWLGLMGCCGLRCCEIAWLQVADVEVLDSGAGLLHLEGKGGKRRVVPVGSMLMASIRPFARGRGPLFTRPSDGRAHTPNAVSRRVGRFLAEINVQGTAHSLRHRFGTDLHALDPDLYRQAKIMGHASVDTTQRYTEVSPIEAAQHIETLTARRLRSHGRGGRSAA